MPWKCPACHVPIQHSEVEPRPRPGALYRCHICRLELVFDAKIDKLAVAPMHEDGTDKKERSTH